MAMMRPSSLNEMYEAKTVVIQKNAKGFYQWDNAGTLCCILGVYDGRQIGLPNDRLYDLAENGKITKESIGRFYSAIHSLDQTTGRERHKDAIQELASILGLTVLIEAL